MVKDGRVEVDKGRGKGREGGTGLGELEGPEDDLEDLYEDVDEDDLDDEGGFEWDLTNIGAVLSMVGLILAVATFAMLFMTGIVFYVLIIPGLAVLVVGYILIVKDHLDKKKRGRRADIGTSRRTVSDEE